MLNGIGCSLLLALNGSEALEKMENHCRAMDGGCNEVITKPVTNGVLFDRLKHYPDGGS